LRALPGVRAAGAISSFPLLGLPGSLTLRVRDAQVPPGERVQFRLAMPGYFEAMGIPIREGRDFAVSDDRSKGTAALVAIVNRAFADRYLSGAKAIGRDVGVMTSPWIHVIGVVDNVRSVDLTTPPVPELYVSPLQVSSSGEMTLALRTLPGITLTSSTVRAAIAQVAPGVAVTSMGALDARLAEQRRPQRFSTAFLTLLAILTMSLAAASAYSLVSYAVSTRAREIAIRRVLGAEERLIARRMLAHAGFLIAIGAIGGIGMLMLIARTSQRVLLGSHTIDPVTVGVAALILILITLFASLMPVRRAIDRPLREVLLSD
jgi:putative ABC transport system permease protein